MERISIGQLYPSAGTPVSARKAPIQATVPQAGKPSFENLLQNQLQNQKSQIVRLSHHAEVRLEQRGIELQPEQLSKIESAIDQAASKGAKDALMLLEGMALIVNIPNRTIVTAIDGKALKDNVFTKIDSAVIIS
ncbi:flagellar operon protein [Paenibacillus eucommiae]|uniref:Flagellar operon protein n=2 Tax=Paenibacillus eucommiae TaxID=1355755 RepID=A0ABS4IV06_9BACL|nr:flagellar operon protein [Paenibacillus eucommiae]